VRLARAAALAVVVILLSSACATAPPAPVAGQPWEQRNRQLDLLPDWQASGRLSVTTPGDSVQGNFEWRQRPDWVEVRLRGPLGAGGLFVYGPPEMLTAIGRDGERAVLQDPELDLQVMFGFGLPVRSLRYWLLGIADERYEHAYEFDAQGLPATMQQRGWEMRYSGWRELTGELMPRRIDLAAPELAIRIVLDSWSPGLDPP
jgi:outer membrane lipoprotein LolB